MKVFAPSISMHAIMSPKGLEKKLMAKWRSAMLALKGELASELRCADGTLDGALAFMLDCCTTRGELCPELRKDISCGEVLALAARFVGSDDRPELMVVSPAPAKEGKMFVPFIDLHRWLEKAVSKWYQVRSVGENGLRKWSPSGIQYTRQAMRIRCWFFSMILYHLKKPTPDAHSEEQLLNLRVVCGRIRFVGEKTDSQFLLPTIFSGEAEPIL